MGWCCRSGGPEKNKIETVIEIKLFDQRFLCLYILHVDQVLNYRHR